MANARKPLPVTVLTGFLGAGKTTLLRDLLARPEGLRLGVLVNDFGAINIDAALVVEGSSESVSLSNGCVCCSIQSELVEAVRALVAARPDLDRIVIEASGVSRSLPLADTMTSAELADVVFLDGMFCLVDAASFDELDYAATELAIDQITGADLILLNKVDLVTPTQRARLTDRLSGLMPHLRIVPSTHGQVPRDVLFGLRTGAAHGHTHADHVHGPDCGCGHDHAHPHTEAFASWSWRTSDLLDERKLAPALRKLGTGLLRAKGVLHVCREDGSTGVLEYQQVGKRSHISPIAGSAIEGSALVAIGLSGRIDAGGFARLLEGCRVV